MYAPEPSAKPSDVVLPLDWESIGREVRARTLEAVALHFALTGEAASEMAMADGTATEIASPERLR